MEPLAILSLTLAFCGVLGMSFWGVTMFRGCSRFSGFLFVRFYLSTTKSDMKTYLAVIFIWAILGKLKSISKCIIVPATGPYRRKNQSGFFFRSLY